MCEANFLYLPAWHMKGVGALTPTESEAHTPKKRGSAQKAFLWGHENRAVFSFTSSSPCRKPDKDKKKGVSEKTPPFYRFLRF